MFEASDKPRLFGLPCGVDYPREVVRGFMERMAGASPERVARAQIIVNTSKLGRAIGDAFGGYAPGLKPRIRLLSRLPDDPVFHDLELPQAPLRQKLDMARLVEAFLAREAGFAPKSGIFDLADSLVSVVGELHEAGAGSEALEGITIPNASRHWQESLQFLGIAFPFLDRETGGVTAEARLREAVERLADDWVLSGRDDPVLVVGSTGSRPTTALLMEAVARLPQGAVIFPGADPHVTPRVWATLRETGHEEHPQKRLVSLAETLGLGRTDVMPWSDGAPFDDVRNRLVSLAMRPAPVTDDWMREGPKFAGVGAIAATTTLIEAPDIQTEATAAALVLREGVEAGLRSVLVTPDRDLARRVTAELDRWRIVPDDSAGVPLNQTAPGRLLRHVVGLLGQRITTEELLVLLKHPLTATGASSAGFERGFHLLWSREMEVHLRRRSRAYPTIEDMRAWAMSEKRDPAQAEQRQVWVEWVGQILPLFVEAPQVAIGAHLDRVLDIAGALVRGPMGESDAELWAQGPGRAVRHLVETLAATSEAGDVMSVQAFGDLFRALISRETVRDPSPTHPGVMIWGTLEARFLDADRVVLGGLNETVWPEAPASDPWFSRDMRRQAGLSSPDQKTGLSAHDFQQAIGAREVVLIRARRNAETETVPSRWVSRLTNLMEGMSGEGKETLREMRARGERWIERAKMIETPEVRVAPAHRPSPRPPVDARPRQLSVTRLETLIRDPYEIYATRVLKLNKLDPLTRSADARDRGTALHTIMERYLSEDREETVEESRARLLAVAEAVLAEVDEHPATARLWLGRLRRITAGLVDAERARKAKGDIVALEAKGAMHVPEVDFSITGTVDRVDRHKSGGLIIYDYKSGTPPTAKQVGKYAIQLDVEAMMAVAGKIDGVAPESVVELTYIGLNSALKLFERAVSDVDIETMRKRLIRLIATYDDPATGYTSRRAMQSLGYVTDFEHLARYGEWSDWDEALPEDVS
ncbi:double-strand break repair protein AddB [Celeribacter arenosi]|uniref:Double-strand break repair protein AddB n=1 Tax=Celeribacter arenosi TaxID=792649 RepID=A0ABP7JY20_9RHOB